MQNQCLDRQIIDKFKNTFYDECYDSQDFCNILHFISLQPYYNARVVSQPYANGFITRDNALYIWMPTPPEDDSMQKSYVQKSRANIEKLVAKYMHGNTLILDLRNNIGGNFFTFYNTLLPLLRLVLKPGKNILLFGEDTSGELSNIFYEENNFACIKFSSGHILSEKIIPAKNVLSAKQINETIILVNERTMSSAEIICIILLENFPNAKIYGCDTGGLTNGCNMTKLIGVEIKVPIFIFKASNIANNAKIADGCKNILCTNYNGKIPAARIPSSLQLFAQ
jgi:Peptidase family S41